MKPLIFLLFAMVCFTGCATTGPRYQISIGNEHPSQPIRDVHVQAPGLADRTFARIAPAKVAALEPRRGQPPEEITLTWTDVQGQRHSKTILSDPTEAFSGQWVLAIHTDNQIASTLIPQNEEDLSILPWNTPESWEGAIAIPGMNDR